MDLPEWEEVWYTANEKCARAGGEAEDYVFETGGTVGKRVGEVSDVD